METSVCQRWLSGRHSWRPAGELIDPRRFEVAPVEAADAKAFVRAHHYSRSCCSLVRRHGLYAGGALVGVAVAPAAPPVVEAPAAVAPTPARPSTARSLPAPRPEPRAEQLGLFGGGGR